MRINGTSDNSTSAEEIAAIQQQIDSIKSKLDNYPEFARHGVISRHVRDFYSRHKIIIIIAGAVVAAIGGLIVWRLLTKKS